MPEIIPAILPKSFEDLNDHLSQVAGLVPIVQIDILDGKFTAGKSWPNIANPDPDFVKIIREEEPFPYSEDLEFEFDLMLADPSASITQWISAGALRLIAHIESFPDAAKVLEFVKDFKEQYGRNESIITTGLGMAININTANQSLDAIVAEIDFVQCMGIAEIGSQGQHFDERVLDKIRSLRSQYPKLPISVDGGVNLTSAPRLIEAGANRLVVGSAIFGSDDIAGTIEMLETL